MPLCKTKGMKTPFSATPPEGEKDGVHPAELPANANLPIGQTSFSTDKESIEIAAQRSLVENSGGIFNAPTTCSCRPPKSRVSKDGGGRPGDTEDPEC